MADGRGGYRQPRNPAPVSGPGQLSRRTDGGPQQTTQPMTGMGYGENAEFNAIQGAAPLAAAPMVSNTRARRTSPTGNGAAAAPVQLFSPTGFPEEPVTAGANVGPGPGPAPYPQTGQQRASLVNTFRKIQSYTNDPKVDRLITILEARGF
jgi:hypothetical protein